MPNPLDTYESASMETMSGRELEATALTRSANKLGVCRDSWDDADLKIKLAEALRFNQRLWTFFQAELTKEENPLPIELKQNILNLSLFIDKRTFETLAAPSPEKLNILIDINLNLAAGLREKP